MKYGTSNLVTFPGVVGEGGVRHGAIYQLVNDARRLTLRLSQKFGTFCQMLTACRYLV